MTNGRDGKYEYRYRFEIDHTIIPLYRVKPSNENKKSYLFELRTDFILKRSNGAEEVIGSERLDACWPEEELDTMLISISIRLDTYWMGFNEADDFTRAAYTYARAHTQCVDGMVVPVVLHVAVVTVQLKEEEIEITRARSITGEKMLPCHGYTWWTNGEDHDRERKLFDQFAASMSVRKVDGSESTVDVCSLCSHPLALGSDTIYLECLHEFHCRCLFDGMLSDPDFLCPDCGLEPDLMER